MAELQKLGGGYVCSILRFFPSSVLQFELSVKISAAAAAASAGAGGKRRRREKGF